MNKTFYCMADKWNYICRPLFSFLGYNRKATHTKSRSEVLSTGGRHANAEVVTQHQHRLSNWFSSEVVNRILPLKRCYGNSVCKMVALITTNAEKRTTVTLDCVCMCVQNYRHSWFQRVKHSPVCSGQSVEHFILLCKLVHFQAGRA